MARRGRGEGSIKHRADGRWEAAATLGGQRRSFYGATRGEVVKKLSQAQRDHEQGLLIGDARQTVEAYLNEWLESKRPPEVRQSTWDSYEGRLRVHVIPVIGKARLSELTAQHIQKVTAQGLSKGIASSTLAEVYGVLRQALSAAVRLGVLAVNVTDRTSRPRRARVEMHPLVAEEARRFVEVTQTHWLGPLFSLALSTGMRQGELLGLHWRDVDLEGGRLSVVASLNWRAGKPVYSAPKTRRSRRQIKLSEEMIARLRQQRQRQRLARVAAGALWQGDRFDAVFTDEVGFPLQRMRVRANFYRALADAGLPRIRFHDLRHTCATLLLLQRVHPKIVSELLGHSSVSITLDLYSHVLPEMQSEAAQAMTMALGW